MSFDKSKLFDGRAIVINATRDFTEFQANIIRCPYCKKEYSSIDDINMEKVIEPGNVGARASVYRDNHGNFTMRFRCSCTAIITLLAPLSSEEVKNTFLPPTNK